MDDMLTTDYDGCGRRLVGVRRLSRKTLADLTRRVVVTAVAPSARPTG